MAEFPLPLSPSSLMLVRKGKDAKLWVSDPNPNPHPQGFIATPAIGHKPYGIGSCFVELGLYSYRYQQAIRPFQARPQPQVNMNMNESLPKSGKVNVAQGQSSMFGVASRGTGVFHPPYQPRSRRNRGRRNKKEADQRSKNASTGNDGLVMQEECDVETPSDSDLGLPKEWTY